MKVRIGFVGNSSSSSYLIVGTEVTDKMLKSLGFQEIIDEDGYSYLKTPDNWEDGYGEYHRTKQCESFMVGNGEEPSLIGIPCEELLKQNKTLDEIKAIASDTIEKEHGIKISSSKMSIHFGEATSE